MPTLKDISLRLKSIKNIQKITKSMKMVSAAKYARAERELKPARPYGEGAQAFYERADVPYDEKKPKQLLVAISSDRGLCGAIHSSVAKRVKTDAAAKTQTADAAALDYRIVAVGDKARSLLARQYADKILFHAAEIGRKAPVFGDAGIIAERIINSGYQFDQGKLYYNYFKSVVSYQTKTQPIYSFDTLSHADKINLYDDVDEETLRSYQEFSLASLIFYALKESTTSEQSARMTAMDNASKNAGEIIGKLTLKFNRTRQAVITKELIEIISGAAAL